MDELEQLVETPDSNAAGNAAAEDDNHDEQLNDNQVDPNSDEQIEEDEEVEIGGKKVAMPKSIAAEIKAGTMRQADYTRKTQEVAEERKAAAAEREQNRQQAAQSQQYIKEVARVHALDDALEQFKDVNWMELSDQDPDRAQKLNFQYQALLQQRQQAAQAVTQKQHEHALAEQQNLAKQVQEADAYFKREIPDWSEERSARLQQFAIEQGLPADKLALMAVQNPALAKLLHKAELFDQLEKKQAMKPRAPAAPPAPVTRVGAVRAAAAKDPDKMSPDEWLKWRNDQVRRKG